MLTKALAFFVLLGSLALIAWGGFRITQEILFLYSQADPGVRLAMLTASGSEIAFILNNAIQSTRERKSRFFESKREAYGEFFDQFSAMIDGQLDPENDDAVAAFRRLRRDIMVWGSPTAIRAFSKFSAESGLDPNPEPKVLFRRTEEFLRALRKDLGHNDITLDNLALSKMILRGEDHGSLD